MKNLTVQYVLDLNNILNTISTQSVRFTDAVYLLDTQNTIKQEAEKYNTAFANDPSVVAFKQLKDMENSIALKYCKRDGTNNPITNAEGSYFIDSSKVKEYKEELEQYYSSLTSSVKDIVNKYLAVQSSSLSMEVSLEINVRQIFAIVSANDLSISMQQLQWFRDFLGEI